jgi:cytochrome P450
LQTSTSIRASLTIDEIAPLGRADLAGSAIAVIVGSANRDSAYYDNSEEFDLDRPAHHHLAFGTGPEPRASNSVASGVHLVAQWGPH